jgi:DNA-binding protein YbaB
MFDKIKAKAAAKAMGISDKQMAEMQALQKQIEEIEIRHEDNGIVVKVSGDMKIKYIEINGEHKEDIEKVINKALNKVQKEVSMKMAGSLRG